MPPVILHCHHCTCGRTPVSVSPDVVEMPLLGAEKEICS